MPKRKRGTPATRRRKRRRLYRRRGRIPRSIRPRHRARVLGGFPGKLAVKLRFTTHETLSFVQPPTQSTPSDLPPVPGDGSNLANQYAFATFRANGPVMPKDFGLVQPANWDQPMGFDDFEKVYDRVTCIGSKIKVRLVPAWNGNVRPHWTAVEGSDPPENAQGYAPAFANAPIANGAAWNPIYAGVYIDQDPPSVLDDIETNIERGSIPSKPKVIRMLKSGMNGNGYSTTMTCKFSPHKFFSIPRKDSILTDDTLGSLVTTLPDRKAYFTVFTQAVPGSQYDNSSHVPMIAQVTIDYICVFSEKKPQVGSHSNT